MDCTCRAVRSAVIYLAHGRQMRPLHATVAVPLIAIPSHYICGLHLGLGRARQHRRKHVFFCVRCCKANARWRIAHRKTAAAAQLRGVQLLKYSATHAPSECAARFNGHHQAWPGRQRTQPHACTRWAASMLGGGGWGDMLAGALRICVLGKLQELLILCTTTKKAVSTKV